MDVIMTEFPFQQFLSNCFMIQSRSLWYTSGTLQDGSVRWNGDGTLSTAGSVLLSNIAHTDPNLRFIVYRYSGRFIYGCLGFFSLFFIDHIFWYNLDKKRLDLT